MLNKKIRKKSSYLKSTLLIVSAYFLFVCFSGQTIAQNNSAASANRVFLKKITPSADGEAALFNAFENKVLFNFPPDSFKDNTDIEITELNEPLSLPWPLDKISPIYQIEIKNKNSYLKLPYELKLNYEENDHFKKIFFYDKNCSCWKPMPTLDNTWRNIVTTNLTFDFVRLAVFSYPDILTVGQASWYRHKNGLFAASPDFPKGTRLRVINKNNNKFVDVTVNDFGPDKKIHPDRVLDLDSVAFKKIASSEEGHVPVVVVLISLPKNTVNLFSVPDSGAKTELAIKSGSGVILQEATNAIIWSQNAFAGRPLASLTKMIAVSAFLDTKPALDDVVAYKTQDEKYNYEYCEPWQSAKLNIKEGETLTIKDLIYVSLAGSANNTIESLVRVSGLTRPEFIAEMNKKAKAWGASSTIFYEPTGLSPLNMSSALDYAIITKEVLKNPIIQEVSTIAEYKFSTINTKLPHLIKNTNSLIKNNNYTISGSKTGYLDEAGYCLMTRVEKENDSLIFVVMGASDKNQSYADMANLIKYGFRNN